jgi:hypothetical protein
MYLGGVTDFHSALTAAHNLWRFGTVRVAVVDKALGYLDNIRGRLSAFDIPWLGTLTLCALDLASDQTEAGNKSVVLLA